MESNIQSKSIECSQQVGDGDTSIWCTRYLLSLSLHFSPLPPSLPSLSLPLPSLSPLPQSLPCWWTAVTLRWLFIGWAMVPSSSPWTGPVIQSTWGRRWTSIELLLEERHASLRKRMTPLSWGIVLVNDATMGVFCVKEFVISLKLEIIIMPFVQFVSQISTHAGPNSELHSHKCPRALACTCICDI